ncbi:unnamed protein product, partial [Polarella glacialis]
VAGEPPELEVGMLAVAAELRGQGFGSRLMREAEGHARKLGFPALRLELLTPKDWKHEQKVKLDIWYRRLGFVPTAVGDFGAEFPHLRGLLTTEVNFTVYQKQLL